MKPLKTTAIPEISYSSSEDEDFFDAEDDDSDDNDDDEGVTTTDMRTPPATLDLSSIGGQFFSLVTLKIQIPSKKSDFKILIITILLCFR